MTRPSCWLLAALVLVLPAFAQAAAADAAAEAAVPVLHDGARTIFGYGKPSTWFIHPYVDVLGHDYETGIRQLVLQAHAGGHDIAIGVAAHLEDVDLTRAKDLTFVFTYKNINDPLPEQARRLIFLNTWLLPKVTWPASRAARPDVVVLGSRTLGNDGDGLASNKQRWWQIQQEDSALTLTVLDGAGYYLPLAVWRSTLYKLIMP